MDLLRKTFGGDCEGRRNSWKQEKGVARGVGACLRAVATSYRVGREWDCLLFAQKKKSRRHGKLYERKGCLQAFDSVDLYIALFKLEYVRLSPAHGPLCE